MAFKIRPEKAEMVTEIKEKLHSAKSIVVTDYMGLNVAQITELRRKLRESKVEYKVYKNTLAQIALKELDINGLEEYLKGPTALAFSYDDAVAPAKVLVEYQKKNEKLKVRAGIVEGKVYDNTQIVALSKLPSRNELLSQLLRTMQGPITGIVTVLSGNMRNMVCVLNAIKEQKEKG